MGHKPDPLINAAWRYLIGPLISIWWIFTYAGVVLTGLCTLAIILIFIYLYIKFKVTKCGVRYPNELVIGFFHPYCDAGGGGERVLWCGIRAIQKRSVFPCLQKIRFSNVFQRFFRFPAAKLMIYTGDVQSRPDQIIDRAKERFNIELPNRKNVSFIYLHRRKWVEAYMYPYFTLLGQSLGSIWLGLEALENCVPNIFLDTMGYAFTLPLFKYFGGCKVGCYVHYPTISTDMLDKVRSRASTYNNRNRVANSYYLSNLKLIYYKVFAWMYGKAGGVSDLTMVNSSWTEDHVKRLWYLTPGNDVHKIYPPCDVRQFKELKRDPEEDIEDENKVKTILSIGQFRPEKDHALQIRAMFELRQLMTESEWDRVKLVLVGGVRNAQDEKRVQDLKDLSRHLAVEDNVLFKTNLTFDELCAEMQNAFIGIHTMWNEHFGIAVVEKLAAGLLTIAHRSGGPLMDIVIEDANVRNGFLAVHDKEYAAMINFILNMSPEGRMAVRERGRASVDRFSEQEFERNWNRVTEPLISQAM